MWLAFFMAARLAIAEGDPPPNSPPTDAVAPQDQQHKSRTLPNLEEMGVEQITQIRDPFRRIYGTDRVAKPKEKLTELEMHSVDKFRVLGITTGPLKPRALIQAPDGKTHMISENTKIGVRQGYVLKISAKGILVKEKSLNASGQEEIVDVLLTLTGSGG